MVCKVYESIAKVSKELSVDGVSKNRKNTQQNYNFRGIDDVMNALSPLLAKNNLCILPRVLSRETTERQAKSGGSIFYTVVDVEYDFVNTEDGSKHTIKMYGEAMDSADKSTNKAMSQAYKNVAFQAFCIPVEGTPDADAETPELAPATSKPKTSTEAFGGAKPPASSTPAPVKPDHSAKYDEVHKWIKSQFNPETWQRNDFTMDFRNYRHDVIKRSEGMPENLVIELRAIAYYDWLVAMTCTAPSEELVVNGCIEKMINDYPNKLRKADLLVHLEENRKALAREGA